MNYFVLVRGSGSSKVGTAILKDVSKIVRFKGLVVFYCNGGKNVVVVPTAWLIDYGPIEEQLEEERSQIDVYDSNREYFLRRFGGGDNSAI